jgi:hypothetical protein
MAIPLENAKGGIRAGGKSNETKENHAMKLNLEPPKKNCENVVGCATQPTQRVNKPTQRVNKPGASAKAGVPKRFRRLKWNELVTLGDFVTDEHRKFEPWEGPSGFRADAFVKPIYRLDESRSTTTKT